LIDPRFETEALPWYQVEQILDRREVDCPLQVQVEEVMVA
jgi:hypothetical protein